MNYNVPSRNTITVPSRTSGTKNINVPSRASGTKQIMVIEALAVVEALETTVMSNKSAFTIPKDSK
jgi:hypothetical protein